MSNRKFVCFDCRVSVRRDAHAQKVALCPHCGRETNNIGYKIPVPPKTKVSEWEALRKQLHLEAVASVELAQRHRVEEMHSLEKEIEKIESLSPNSGRDSLLKQLKKRLASFHA